MLPLLLLLAAQDPETAIDAERAFNRAAQTEGQWTAFRRFMGEDAVVFTPQPAGAAEALPKQDPPIAVQWWPAESYVSCDGSVAVNTGPWVLPRTGGYFTTVWVRQDDGHHKWTVDAGDALAAPRALPERPRVRTAVCGRKPPKFGFDSCPEAEMKCGQGGSRDGTLVWDWTVATGGFRTFTARLWNGRKFDTVVYNQVAAPK